MRTATLLLAMVRSESRDHWRNVLMRKLTHPQGSSLPRMRRLVPLIVLALFLPSCAGVPDDFVPLPTAPLAATTGTTYAIAVEVLAADAPGTPSVPAMPCSLASPRCGSIAGATLLILDGMFAGQTFTVGENGRLTLTGAEGNMNIEASADGFLSQRLGVGPLGPAGSTRSLQFLLERDAR